jgi:hypothetical protein
MRTETDGCSIALTSLSEGLFEAVHGARWARGRASTQKICAQKSQKSARKVVRREPLLYKRSVAFFGTLLSKTAA